MFDVKTMTDEEVRNAYITLQTEMQAREEKKKYTLWKALTDAFKAYCTNFGDVVVGDYYNGVRINLQDFIFDDVGEIYRQD